MTMEPAPELHALTVEPRSVRAGGTVEVAFRTRNLGASPTPPGVVRFALGEGLCALGPLDLALEPVAPGDDVVAAVSARAPATCEDRTAVTCGATLLLGDARFATNACTVVVRSRAVLDGPASGTFVDALGEDVVRVRAVVLNEGDGPAHGVRLDVAVPAGCVPIGATPCETCLRLDPGARFETAFDARIVEPIGEVCCDEAVAACANGSPAIIPARTSVALHPALARPSVELATTRRRVDVAFAIANDGWVEARDVRAGIAFPASVRLIDGSVTIGGVPAAATARRRDAPARFARVDGGRGGCGIVAASVPARSRVGVALSLAVPPPGGRGEVTVTLGSHEVVAAFATAGQRDVRLHVVDVPRSAAPGAVARVGALVLNAGDEPVEIRCGAAAGAQPPQRTTTHELGGCAFARIPVDVSVPADARDGSTLDAFLVALGGGGELARAAVAVRVREPRIREAALEPELGDDRAARVDAELCAPERTVACTSFEVALKLTVHDDAAGIVLRAPAPAAARYALGSCRIDGTALHDVVDPDTGAACSPLAAESGVELRDVRSGTTTVLTWRLLALDPDGDAPLAIGVEIAVDGGARPPASCAVRVEPRPAFAVRPPQLSFHVAGCSVAPATLVPRFPAVIPRLPEAVPPDAPDELASDLEAPPAEPRFAAAGGAARESHATELRLDAARIDAIARLHHALRGPGLLAHLFALRLFFPSAARASHPLALPFDEARGALEDVFDRLYVKLRIPGFDVCADDLDDARLRAAADGLVHALDLRSVPAGTPCGSPAVLRALVTRLDAPCEPDPHLADAIAAHARALDDALAAYDGLPLELFDDALARRADVRLDAARGALLDALSPYVTSRVPC